MTMILTSLSLPLWPSLSLNSLIYLTLLFPSFCASITHISEWYRSFIKSRILPCHVILIRCDGGTFVAAGNLSLHHGPIAVMLAKQSHEVTKMCIWWYKFTILTHWLKYCLCNTRCFNITVLPVSGELLGSVDKTGLFKCFSLTPRPGVYLFLIVYFGFLLW